MQDTNHKVAAAVQRLEALSWPYVPQRRSSHLALVNEYLRRIALWYDALRREPHPHMPFVDVPTMLVPEVHLPHEIIQRSLHPERMNWLMEEICRHYLHWVAIDEYPQVTQFRLDAPYEPIVRLFERGGQLRMNKGFIDVVSGGGVLIHDWYNRAKQREPIALDNESLDQIDHEDEVWQQSFTRSPWWTRLWRR